MIKKALQVLVVFEFDGIEDPNSPEADSVVEFLTGDCERLSDEYGADCVWVEEASVHGIKAIAAPDLLAALEACLHRLDAHDDQSAPECLAARAAIAKATGK